VTALEASNVIDKALMVAAVRNIQEMEQVIAVSIANGIPVERLWSLDAYNRLRFWSAVCDDNSIVAAWECFGGGFHWQRINPPYPDELVQAAIIGNRDRIAQREATT
jgi:hypothetical protein